MKANELRIGNYVKDPYDGVIKLVSVEKDASMLRPIPLTEEWLLKFGFEIVGKKTLYKNHIAVIPIYKIKKRQMYSCKGARLDSVHRLQNLYFALTGEELILNNNI